jgi:hypothetical protein
MVAPKTGHPVNEVVIMPEDTRLGAPAPPPGEENMAISLTDPFMCDSRWRRTWNTGGDWAGAEFAASASAVPTSVIKVYWAALMAVIY